MRLVRRRLRPHRLFVTIFNYFSTPTDKGAMTLLDGDKISVLLIKFIKATLGKVKLGSTPLVRFDHNSEGKYTCELVQTAYANGASTLYL